MNFCPHETVTQTNPNGEMTCRTCWKNFKNLGELAGDLSNQVKALEAANRLAQVVHVLSYQADPQTGDLELIMDGHAVPLRGPQTEDECAIEWHELMAKQAREDAESLADRVSL